MKKISLISTVYNEEANISAFLQSYKKQTRTADEYIIVDGGSTDTTVSIIENFSKENPNLNIKLINIVNSLNSIYDSQNIKKLDIKGLISRKIHDEEESAQDKTENKEPEQSPGLKQLLNDISFIRNAK